MRWTERLQGLRLMKFEEVYGRTHRGALSQGEAAVVQPLRTFRLVAVTPAPEGALINNPFDNAAAAWYDTV